MQNLFNGDMIILKCLKKKMKPRFENILRTHKKVRLKLFVKGKIKLVLTNRIGVMMNDIQVQHNVTRGLGKALTGSNVSYDNT